MVGKVLVGGCVGRWVEFVVMVCAEVAEAGLDCGGIGVVDCTLFAALSDSSLARLMASKTTTKIPVVAAIIAAHPPILDHFKMLLCVP